MNTSPTLPAEDLSASVLVNKLRAPLDGEQGLRRIVNSDYGGS
jgi:hypothetical protein